MKLNNEQAFCVELAQKRESFKMQAGAGSGKTTVLEHIARKLGGSSYYLVFNSEARALAKKRFDGLSVNCHTNHSLAYGTYGHAYRDANKLAQHFNYNQIAQLLKVKEFPLAYGNYLASSNMAYLGFKTVKNFCESGDAEISEHHAPLLEINDFWLKTVGHNGQFQAQDLIRECVLNARTFWPRMLDLNDPMPITHDVYLKLWALSDPTIATDYILYDESQDANGTIIHVLNRQKCPIFLVGDENQQIYSWRGAVNAMRNFLPNAPVAPLAQSYRFGENIAEVANVILNKMCGSRLRLRGNPGIRSRLDVMGRPEVYINRTNAGCLGTITDLMAAGVKRIYYDHAKSTADLIQGISDLKSFGSTRHIDLKGFRNYSDLQDYLKNNEESELHSVINVTKNFGEQQVISVLREIAKIPQQQAQVTVVTGHRSKGREWDSVELGADFLGREKKAPEGEGANVFYVAATRARKELDISHVETILNMELPPVQSCKAPGTIVRRKKT